MFIYTHIYICTRTYVCMYICIYICTYVHVCCLLVLDSVTSTPQWIHQPEAAWGCVWCLCAWCLRASMCSDILGSLSL